MSASEVIRRVKVTAGTVRPGQSGSIWRLRRRYAATPVIEYQHADTGQRLVVILNNHIGAARYWAAIRARIAGYEDAGWQVIAEGIREAPAADWDAAGDAERAARQTLINMYTTRPAAVAANLGWVHQREGLPRSSTWTYPDITDLDFIRAVGPDAVRVLADRDAALAARLGGRLERYETIATPVHLRRLARPHDRLSAAIANLSPAFAEMQVGGRSKLLAAAADPQRGNVLLVGAEHADTVDAALSGVSWGQTGERDWLTVGRLPFYPWSVWQMACLAAATIPGNFQRAWAAETARQATAKSPGGGPVTSAGRPYSKAEEEQVARELSERDS